MKIPEKPDIAQLLIIFAVPVILFACAGIFSILALSLYTGENAANLSALFNGVWSQRLIDAFKITQVISTVFVYLAPSLILPWLLYRQKPLNFLGAKTKPSIILFLLTILIFYASSPLIDLAGVWNSKLQLPGFMHNIEKWMRDSEDTNDRLTGYFLKMPDIAALFINILIMAVLPAIGEEFMFRGFIQRTLASWFKNPHWAILLSAAIFSFVHFQFYGFIPRMMLGVLFGYLFYWSGDIKLAIFAHFINNFAAVMVEYRRQHPEAISILPEDAFMNHIYIYYLSVIALGILVFTFYWLSRHYHKSVDDKLRGKPGRWIKIYSSTQTFQADIIAGNLESEGIEAVVINKKSSSYNMFGEAEVHVREHDAEKALEIIKKENHGETQS